MDLQKLIIVPLIAGAIFIGACAGQQYQQRKVSENNLEQYFPETYEEKMIRRNKGKRFSNELINTGKADRYSAAQIACSSISLREGTNGGNYIILRNRYNECMRAQVK